MKVLIIFGTRPEAIKMAPVISELKKYKKKFLTTVCVTAQHREMLDQVLKVFDIKPDYDLGIMSPGQDLFSITSCCLKLVKDVLMRVKPDLVLVQGDTTTAAICALAAYYIRIPIAHIEAGLRTHDKYNPFPEEGNRCMITALSDIHFAPTEWAKDNLVKEGIAKKNIILTGNTVVDALLEIKRRQKADVERIKWKQYFKEKWDLEIPHKNKDNKIILVTGHRRESFGKGFRSICAALKEIAIKRRDGVIVYPVHLNPNVQKPVNTILGGIKNIRLISPIEYEPFIYLMTNSYLVLTDSGGVQEEAPSLGKPVLVMRDTTERPEGIKAKVVRLVGTKKEDIVYETMRLLSNKNLYSKMSKAQNPYGDGKAAQRIAKYLKENA
jgi:UDP-N-acetylglucosamine 2-epimerase (non-hydrolysing)